MISSDTLILQNISTAAIILFGLAQLLIAFWLIGREIFSARRQKGQHEEAEQWHKETITAWNNQHTQTMTMLNQQRDADIQRHEEAMTALTDAREESEHKHQAVMAQLAGVREDQDPDKLASRLTRAVQQSQYRD